MNVAAGCVAACALALAAPSLASADPSLRADPDHGKPGDDVSLRGKGWLTENCPNRVTLYFRQGGRRLKLGSAIHGNGRFVFDTHYQAAEPGQARFIGRQVCGDTVHKAIARVTVGDGPSSESVKYRGQTEHGGRVSFMVVDGNEVRQFRFMNRCAKDRMRGTRVPGRMPIGDITFTRRGNRFKIFGRFRPNGVVKGRAREVTKNCDSEKMTWRAERVG
ncbi:MAG TPA: hypothetical protein VD790_12625 [Thermoleophilaceae bacterium]|nr:hypothetical protein [Thermoleophilaceae bacterium]